MIMKNNRSVIGASLGIVSLFLALALSPVNAETTAVRVTASVVDQTCQGGDFVNVTLTATVEPPQQNVRFVWDFDNDGVFDTQPNTDPTVTHAYPDEATVTARVGVLKGGRMKTDTVTFGTMRCGG